MNNMPVTEHTFIKLEARNFLMLIIGIVSIVSSFWIGYGKIMQSQNDGFARLEARINQLEQKTGYQIGANTSDISDLKVRVAKLEAIR